MMTNESVKNESTNMVLTSDGIWMTHKEWIEMVQSERC